MRLVLITAVAVVVVTGAVLMFFGRAKPLEPPPMRTDPCLGCTRAERERSCEAGSGPACTRLGEVLREGDYPNRINVDPSGATKAFERACGLGDGVGCLRLGESFEKGRGAKVDREAASRAYVRACELKVAEACGR